jgi:phage gpG-like protein
MVGVGVTVSIVEGQDKVRRILAEVDADKVLGTIGQRLLNWTTKSIKAGGDPPWQRMAQSTLERRRRVYGDGGTSDRHFAPRYQTLLQQSAVSAVITQQQAVTVGTEARYGIYHHFGAARGSWRLPSRPIAPSPAVAEDLTMAVVNAMLQRVTAIGGR